MKEEIDILGFLDNSKEKQQTGYEGYPCFALDQAAADDETGIILTISQFARPTAMENLKALQLKKMWISFCLKNFYRYIICIAAIKFICHRFLFCLLPFAI